MVGHSRDGFMREVVYPLKWETDFEWYEAPEWGKKRDEEAAQKVRQFVLDTLKRGIQAP